jgi:hypothetical protein
MLPEPTAGGGNTRNLGFETPQVSPGKRPITFVRRRTSTKVRSSRFVRIVFERSYVRRISPGRRDATAAVELCESRHDPTHQHAAWRLVDVLRARDKGRAGLPDREVDLDVVEPVSGKTVDFVDDDALDAFLCQEGEHPLELGSVGALAAIDKLSDDDGAHRSRLTSVRLALCRARKALGLDSALSLVLGRDAQIKNGPCGAVLTMLGPRDVCRQPLVFTLTPVPSGWGPLLECLAHRLAPDSPSGLIGHIVASRQRKWRTLSLIPLGRLGI